MVLPLLVHQWNYWHWKPSQAVLNPFGPNMQIPEKSVNENDPNNLCRTQTFAFAIQVNLKGVCARLHVLYLSVCLSARHTAVYLCWSCRSSRGSVGSRWGKASSIPGPWYCIAPSVTARSNRVWVTSVTVTPSRHGTSNTDSCSLHASLTDLLSKDAFI